MKRGIESGALVPEPLQRPPDFTGEPRYLVLDELVTLGRFDATAPKRAKLAAWKWLHAHAASAIRYRGRTLLIDRATVHSILRERV